MMNLVFNKLLLMKNRTKGPFLKCKYKKMLKDAKVASVGSLIKTM